jgi:hypothetical protein
MKPCAEKTSLPAIYSCGRASFLDTPRDLRLDAAKKAELTRLLVQDTASRTTRAARPTLYFLVVRFLSSLRTCWMPGPTGRHRRS